MSNDNSVIVSVVNCINGLYPLKWHSEPLLCFVIFNKLIKLNNRGYVTSHLVFLGLPHNAFHFRVLFFNNLEKSKNN